MSVGMTGCVYISVDFAKWRGLLIWPLGGLFLTGWWWPGIMIVIGIAAAISGRPADSSKHRPAALVCLVEDIALPLTCYG